jgi:hypothetical protein
MGLWWGKVGYENTMKITGKSRIILKTIERSGMGISGIDLYRS